ncbi:MAG TPA: hypothetical protein VGF73_01490 [Chthoniobacterales bacterium]
MTADMQPQPASSEAAPPIAPGNLQAENNPGEKSDGRKPAERAAIGKTAAKRRPANARKPAAPRKPRATKPAASTADESSISDDDIRMRAYFISERRQQKGLAGDSAHDWLEARRQLEEAARQRA